MISIKNLYKSYPIGKRQLPVLKGLDLEIAKGEMVAIMGASGSGKSTLLNILGMLDVADSGEYHLDDTLIKNLDETRAAQYRNKFLGFVFQSFNLINYKTAEENVAMPLFYQGMGRKERLTKAEQYLNRVGLGDRAEHLPNELSGGQKQRVAIARAFASDPAILFASIEYTHQFAEGFDDISSEVGIVTPGEVRLGDSLAYGLGVAFAINERMSLSLSYSQRFSEEAETRSINGPWQEVVASDANAATFTTGLTYALSQKLSVSTSVGIGLTPDAPDFTFAIKFPFSI